MVITPILDSVLWVIVITPILDSVLWVIEITPILESGPVEHAGNSSSQHVNDGTTNIQ
jgi:hypothetical protein